MWTLVFLSGVAMGIMDNFSSYDRCFIAAEQIKRSVPDVKWARCVKVEK